MFPGIGQKDGRKGMFFEVSGKLSNYRNFVVTTAADDNSDVHRRIQASPNPIGRRSFCQTNKDSKVK